MRVKNRISTAAIITIVVVGTIILGVFLWLQWRYTAKIKECSKSLCKSKIELAAFDFSADFSCLDDLFSIEGKQGSRPELLLYNFNSVAASTNNFANNYKLGQGGFGVVYKGIWVEKSMEMESCVPPGFRFHPTEEELVGYYLKRKINSLKIDLDVIVDIDLYRIEPWDIQDRCRLGYEEQSKWYFFSHKDKKYPTGTRTNRATAAGFWKATRRDKAVLSKNRIIGMRKTLVFYKGRAPNGRKSDWIMHEYRLQTFEHAPPQ
ncbi:unnamed protein product [Camellia sinensis]